MNRHEVAQLLGTNYKPVLHKALPDSIPSFGISHDSGQGSLKYLYESSRPLKRWIANEATTWSSF